MKNRTKYQNLMVVSFFAASSVIMSGCIDQRYVESTIPKPLPEITATKSSLKNSIVLTKVKAHSGPHRANKLRINIEYALNKNNLLGKTKNSKYHLIVNWTRTDLTSYQAITQVANVFITYSIRKSETRSEIYRESINTLFEVPHTASFSSLGRQSMAIGSAVRANVDEFMRRATKSVQ